MLSSIHPLGERARRSRFWVTVTAYIVGSVAGGMLTGATLGGLGSAVLPDLGATVAAAIAAAVAGAGVVIDALRWPLPTWQRQVNEDWLTTYRGWVYGIGFGFQLGLAFVTIVTSASVYATFVLALISGSWTAGLLIGAVFGAARSLVILVATHVQTVDALRRLHRSMQRRYARAHQAAIAAQALVAAVAIGVLAWQ